MTANPLPDPQDSLLALRQRLRTARAERGACPPWEELRDDLLPGGAGRAGRVERLAHRELCPYCGEHVREWQQSLEHASDTLGAIEKGVARGVVAGALKLAAIGKRADVLPEAASLPPAEPLAVSPPPPAAPVPTYVAPAPVAAPRPAPARAQAPAAPPGGPLRLLVVEAADVAAIPESVFLCAGVMGAEVACVARVESLAGDPDLESVCAVVLAGGRPAAEWPEAVRRAKDLAPGRPVVVLSPSGTEPATGARRALGAQLLAAGDPAERLLVALDARLR